MSGHLYEQVAEGPKPTWAVALDRMRDRDGNAVDHEVHLFPEEAIAFVRHYLQTADLLRFTEDALYERNARLDRIERLARGESV